MWLISFTFSIEHRIQVFNVDELVNEAIEAHKNGEIMEVIVSIINAFVS